MQESLPIIPSELKFKITRSLMFRMVHSDGAWANIDMWGNIRLSFFNDFSQLPASGIMRPSQGSGNWNVDPKSFAFQDDAKIIKELDVEVVMNIEVAKVVHALLGAHIRNAETLRKTAQKAEQEKQEHGQ